MQIRLLRDYGLAIHFPGVSQNHRIIQVEKDFEIIGSNHEQSTTVLTSKTYPQVPHPRPGVSPLLKLTKLIFILLICASCITVKHKAALHKK